MASTPPLSNGVATFRFSTEDFPARERLVAWRELYGRQVLRLEHEPQPDLPFQVDLTLRALPGLGIASVASSLLRVGRTRELLADADDSLILQIASCPGVASQFGREVKADSGDAVLLSAADVGTFTFASRSKTLALRLARPMLRPLLLDLHDVPVRVVPKDTEALRLLVRYLDILRDLPALATPELQRLAATHVYDLLGLALGATRDATEIAKGRGVSAARLRAIKADIAEHLGRPNLSVGEIAARHRVTPRYVQMLFETEGTTVTEFVLSQRLARAHRMLADPRFADRSITSVAFDSGFGDLSYFNRTFRRRFGETPSGVRATALRRDDGLT